MKTRLFLVIIALIAVAFSGCSATVSFPGPTSNAYADFSYGGAVAVNNPSIYDQNIRILYVDGGDAVEPFRLLSHEYTIVDLPQGEYTVVVEAINMKKVKRFGVGVAASGYKSFCGMWVKDIITTSM